MSSNYVKTRSPNLATRYIGKIMVYLFLSIIAAIFMAPFLLMIIGSFSETRELNLRQGYWLPTSFYIGNYQHLFGSTNLLLWIRNSFIYLIPVATGALINTLVGYVLSKKRFKGRNFIFLMFLSMMLVPGQVTLVPNFLLYMRLEILNTPWAILIPGLWSISNMFIVRQYCLTLPDSVIEAATIDGSGDFRTFFTIVVPMLKLPIAIMCLFAFIAFWNIYMPVIIFLRDSSLYNLTAGLATLVQKDGNYGVQMVGAVVAMMPVFLVYIFCQRYFIEGVNLSGVKG